MNILNIGSGPVTMDGMAPGISITHQDRRLYDAPVVTGNMEHLEWRDGSFDLVVCVNALDHTLNAQVALKELIRVSNKWVYIDCALIQHTTSGKNHYWDMLEDGTMTNGEHSFNLKDYGFEVKFIDNHGERRYNHVVCRYTK